MKSSVLPRLAGGLVAVLVLLTVQRSAATASVANATKTTLTIPAGNLSPEFPLASNNTPVLVMVAGLENYRYCSTFTLAYTDANAAKYMSYTVIDCQGITAAGAIDVSVYDKAIGAAVPNVYLRNAFNSGKFYFASGASFPVKLIVTQIW